MKETRITVHALDAEGCELNNNQSEGEESMKAAKARANDFLMMPELIAAGMVKVEVRKNGVCEWDRFVNP